MSSIEESVEVEVPVRTAYNQWTQFEEFPHFMEGVEEVRQLSDTRTHWVAEVGGVRREFDAEITEQVPDDRIAWKSTDGPDQAGVVTFHRLGEGRTKVMLQLDVEPEGIAESVGDKLGFIKSLGARERAFTVTICRIRGARRGLIALRVASGCTPPATKGRRTERHPF